MTKLSDSQLVNWMKLTRVKGLGPKRILNVFKQFNSIDEVVSAKKEQLLANMAFTDDMFAEWEKLKAASPQNFFKVIEECRNNSFTILTILDEEFPETLRNIPSAPLTLFLAGNASLLKERKIAVVGTREPSEKAGKFAHDYAKTLAENGYVIVSGGARGIDTAAHKGALEAGKTICVVGNGFFNPYPPENAQLFEEIRKTGLLVSEHLPNFPGNEYSLLNRNRITSGLSRALLLCASKEKGGAMVQTTIAAQQRVPIFCPALDLEILPNEGIKKAIAENGAKEIRSPQEILDYLTKREV